MVDPWVQSLLQGCASGSILYSCPPTYKTTTWQHHRAFQKELRTFVDETLYPDAQALQENGKKPSKHVFEEFAKRNIHAMRLGPGEHLKGRLLMNETVKPEEVR